MKLGLQLAMDQDQAKTRRLTREGRVGDVIHFAFLPSCVCSLESFRIARPSSSHHAVTRPLRRRAPRSIKSGAHGCSTCPHSVPSLSPPPSARGIMRASLALLGALGASFVPLVHGYDNGLARTPQFVHSFAIT
jgi:hypothetical protein